MGNGFFSEYVDIFETKGQNGELQTVSNINQFAFEYMYTKMTSIQMVSLIQCNLEIKASGNIKHWSVFIGILLQSTAWYAGVKQHRPQFVLGWVTVLCQFLLIILQMRL